jgi:hypothetical protein
VTFPEPPPPGHDGDRTERLWSPPEGLEPPPRTAGSRRGVLTAALTVLGLAAAGVTGAVLVRSGDDPEAQLAASSSTPSPSASTDDGRPDGRRFGHRPFLGGPLGGMAGAIHGELVVPDGNGGWTTMVVQRGTATSVGSDSITVRSEDGWTRTYEVPAGTGVNAQRDGLDSIDEGDDVVVMAERSGGDLTAKQVVDLDAIADGLPGFGVGRHGHGLPGMPGLDDDEEVPAPAPSGSTEGTAARV